MKIIPAIDLIEGKCVRLTKGDYATQKTYREDPLEVAKEFEAHGIRYLHLVDLDGARARKIVNHKTLNRIATQTRLHIDFGGGLNSQEDLQVAFDNGAQQVTGGSIAVKDPGLFLEWITAHGAEKIILGADCLHRNIATNGWQETREVDVLDFIRSYEGKGIRQVICTDISRDGMLQGPSFDLYTEILSQTAIRLIASGGITTLADLQRLQETGCSGAIIGKAIYEGHITLNDLQKLC